MSPKAGVAGGPGGARIVLVAPMYAGNVGAVARVAANFGVEDLRLVAPQCDWRGQDARRMAKGAGAGRLDSIRESIGLDEALVGASAAVGFTRRVGEGRRPTVALGELNGRFVREPVALVFGREDSGLSGEELARCTHVCSIATAPEMPSLNLSHAVAIAVAAFRGVHAEPGPRSAAAEVPVPRVPHAPVEAMHELLAHLEQALRDVGLVRGGNPEKLLSKLRPMLYRAAPTADEIAALRTYLSKTQVMLGTKINPRRRARSSS